MATSSERSPNRLFGWLESIPWALLVVGSLTLGLAPFFPQPHLVEKLGMLAAGELTRPIDIFDLVLHGAFPLLLLLRVVVHVKGRREPSSTAGGE